jgi:SAM-dependent methyltransferase
MSRQALLDDLARRTPQQPATVAWRVIELDHLLRGELPGGTGIDVGCGDGTIVEVIRSHRTADWRLVGVDPDPRETALARRSRQYERVHTASAAEIPEPGAAFDFAFSNSVLEHIPDLPAVLAEVARVLKPGAPFLATVPSDGFNRCLGGPGLLAPLLGRRRAAYEEGIDRRLAHVNLWGEARWREELERAGMQLDRAEPYMPCDDVRRWERVSNWTAGVLFGLMRGRRRPIDITRSLDLQSGSARGRRLARVTAVVAGTALSSSRPAPSDVPASAPGYGCLLLRARRSP